MPGLEKKGKTHATMINNKYVRWKTTRIKHFLAIIANDYLPMFVCTFVHDQMLKTLSVLKYSI